MYAARVTHGICSTLLAGRCFERLQPSLRRQAPRCMPVTQAALSYPKNRSRQLYCSKAAAFDSVSVIPIPASDRDAATPSQQPQPLANVTALWLAYLQALGNHPLLTKAATCGVGQALSDFAAQAATTQGFAAAGFDLHRSLVLTSFATVVGGPAGHVWHRLLDGRVCKGQPTSSKAVASKLALDQGVMCPLMNSVFVCWLHIFMYAGSPAALLPFVKATLPTLLVANWRVWPVANFVAFKWVPQDLRILYQNALGIAWGTYISLLSAGSFG